MLTLCAPKIWKELPPPQKKKLFILLAILVYDENYCPKKIAKMLYIFKRLLQQ